VVDCGYGREKESREETDKGNSKETCRQPSKAGQDKSEEETVQETRSFQEEIRSEEDAGSD